MSMNNDPENFDGLRRLLALKRHEVPPPGYFHSFSHQVIARIEAGERGEEGSLFRLWLSAVPRWLHGFWQTLEAKPVFASAISAGACALVVAGALYSPTDSASSTLPQLPKNQLVQLPSSTPLLGEQTFSSIEGADSSDSLFQAYKNLEKERGVFAGQ